MYQFLKAVEMADWSPRNLFSGFSTPASGRCMADRFRLPLLLLMLLLFTGHLQAQIAQRGSATTNTNSGTNISTLTINKPTGVVAGDVLIVSILQNETDNDNGGLSNASATGWTLIDGRTIFSEGTSNGNNAWYGTVLYRVADASDGASYTFNFSTSNGRPDMAIGSIVAFSGVSATGGFKADGTAGGPFDIDPAQLNVTTSDGSSGTASSVTTTSANAAVVMLAMVNNDRTYSNWVATNPAALTELYDNTTTGADNGSVGAAWGIRSTAGATGNGTVTLSGSNRCGAMFLVLRPCAITVDAGPALASICQGASTPALGGAVGGLATGGIWTDGGVGGTFSPNATTLNATYTPPSNYSGTVTLTLTTTGASCGVNSASKTLEVNQRPAVTASTSLSSICNAGTVNLTGSVTGAGTTVLFTENFENSSNYTPSGGSTKTGTSGGGDRPATASFVVSPTTSYWVNNGTATITTSNVTGLTNNGKSKFVSLRLASFSIGATNNGADVGDSVTVAISLNNGASYSNELVVKGNNNAFWSFTSGTGIASTTYDGNNITTAFQPAAGSARTTDGYSTMRIDLPASATQVRVRVVLLNNSGSEAWVVDDIVISETLDLQYAWTSLPSGFTSSLQSPTGVSVSQSTTYTLTATNTLNSCAGSDTAVVTILPAPAAPAGTGGSRCGTGTVTISAAAGSGETIDWYAAATGGTPLSGGTGVNSFTTPGISSTTTYYAQARNTTTGCISSTRTAVTATVLSNNTAGAGSAAPTLCVNTALTPITHTTQGATGIGTPSNLPPGVTASWSANVITISGTPSATGNYSYSIPLTGGCGGGNATGTINVIAPPSATISYAGSPFCRSISTQQSVNLTGTSGGTYSATPSGLTINSSTGAITPSTSTANTYTVTYTVAASGGCSAFSTTTTVVIDEVPVVTVSPASETICPGASTILTASGAATYSWSPATGLDAITGTAVTANPTSATTYTVTGTAANGCTATATAQINISTSSPSVPVITASGTSICQGESVTLTATASAVNSTQTFTATGGPATIPTIGNASLYPWVRSVSGLPTSGVTVANVTISGFAHVYPQDVDIVLVSPSGVAVVLMSDVNGTSSVTGRNYTIQDGATVFSTGTNASGTYAPTNNGATDAFAAPGPGSVTQASPALSLFTGDPNGNWSLYVVDDASLDGGSINAWSITFTVPNPIIYSWTPATGLSNTNQSNTLATPAITTTYTVSASSAALTCTTSASITITVNGVEPSAPINVNASSSSTINIGDVVSFTADGSGNTVNWYSQASGGTLIGTGNTITTPIQCVAGNYVYYAETQLGSCASDRVPVNFTVRPLITSDPLNGLICSAGGSVNLTLNALNASGIAWSPATGLTSTNTAVTTALPTVTTSYAVSATVTGCGSVNASFNVGVIEGASFTPSATPVEVCAGAEVLLASNLAATGFTASAIAHAPSSAVNAIVLANAGNAQVPTTTCTYCPLDDAGWEGIPLGFTFNFFGNTYSTVNVGTNGLLQFGGYNGAATGGLGDFTFSNALPNVTEPLNIIAGVAVDLNATSGSISYWTEGIAPTRVFVMQWSAIPGYNNNGTNTSQIKLFETTGIVEVHVSSSTSTANKVVGLQNANASIGSTAFSGGGAITNQAWRFVPGANYSFQWLESGSPIQGATAANYSFSTSSTPGVINYGVQATNPSTGCVVTKNVSVTVNEVPAAPSATTAYTYCQSASATVLTANAGSGNSLVWYTQPSGGTGSSSAPTPSTTNAGSSDWYVAQLTAQNCESPRTAINVLVNPAPSAPAVTSPVAYCQNDIPTALSASSDAGNTLSWYTVSTGGTGSSNAIVPSTSAPGSIDYYVSQISGANSCESQRVSITVTVTATPAAPTVTNTITYCQNASASALTATGSSLQWFTTQTGGTALGAAPVPSTSTSGTTSYFVSQTVNGCTSLRAEIDVIINPELVPAVAVSASSTSACSGGSITFSASPTEGGSSPSYQWYLNGSAVSGQTASSFIYSTPASGDAVYVTMVSNATGCLTTVNATGNTITLTGTASTPTVSISASTATAICAGTAVSFSISSTANMGASPTYQWKLNGVNINAATSSSYTTSALTQNDQITLHMTSSLDAACLTTATATSAGLTFTIRPATQIVSQPVAQSVCAGTNASFSITASGDGALSYQWYKGNTPIGSNASALTSSLTLPSISAADVSSYSVEVSAGCGTVSSSAVALSLSAATAIQTQPAAVTACENSTASLSVVASGEGQISYQWKKSGVDINGATSSLLNFASLAAADAAAYTVSVSAGCGSFLSSSALITVNPATIIVSQPASATICSGNTANLSVNASGSSPISYQWSFNGVVINGANASLYSIPAVAVNNSGQYSVQVSGACGVLTSSVATLTVNSTPFVTTAPASQAICFGSPVTFSVAAGGSGNLTYQWRFGGNPISGATGLDYTLPAVTNADAGSYNVAITGSCGTINSSAALLTVNANPAVPQITNTGSLSFCSGGNVSLSTGTATGYSWSDGATTQQISVASSGVYTVTVSNENGCTASSSPVSVTVFSLPLLTTGTVTSACDSPSVSLSSGITSATSGLTLQYYSDPGLTTSISSTVTSTGTYYVKATDANVCVSSAGIPVVIRTSPSSTITAASTELTCAQSTISLTVPPADQYSWSTGSSASGIQVNSPGVYSVTVTASNACTSSSSLTITQNITPPAATITPLGSTTICAGSTVGLSASSGSSYQWSGGTSAQTIQAVGGTYLVTVTGANGCTAVSAAVVVTEELQIPANAGADIIQCSGQFSLSANSPGNLSGFWSVLTGGQNIVINNPSLPNTSAQLLSQGTAVLAWTISSAACGTSSTDQIILNQLGTPVSGSITGISSQCIPVSGGSSTFTFSNNEVSESYNWTIPSGLAIVGSSTSSSINVSWLVGNASNGISGNVCVTAANICSSAAAICIPVNYQSAVPVTPSSISGSSRLCPGESATFSVAAVARSRRYNWSLPAGLTIVSSSDSGNVITVSVGQGYNGGVVSVNAENACGTSSSRSKNLGLNLPGAPAVISGPSTGLCSANGVVFSTMGTPTASSYVWSVPTGASIASAGNSNSITVNMGNSSGAVTVRGQNACGIGSTRSMTVTVAPARPGTITGPVINICTGSVQNYGVATVAGAETYSWIIPPSSQIIGAQNTKDIVLEFGPIAASSQLVMVAASNQCGSGQSRSLSGITTNTCLRNEFDESDFDISVYPNPGNGHFTLDYLVPFENKKVQISIYNSKGRMIMNQLINAASDRNSLMLDLSEFVSGPYLLLFENGSERKTIRLIKE